MDNTNFAFDIVAFNPIENVILGLNESNLKSLIIVLDKKDLTNETESLLSDILKAVNVKHPEQTLLLDASKFKQLRILEVLKKTNIQNMLAFGLLPTQLGLNISDKQYDSIEVMNYKFLFSEPLNILSDNKNSKKLLWNSLIQFFELNAKNAE